MGSSLIPEPFSSSQITGIGKTGEVSVFSNRCNLGRLGVGWAIRTALFLLCIALLVAAGEQETFTGYSPLALASYKVVRHSSQKRVRDRWCSGGPAEDLS